MNIWCYCLLNHLAALQIKKQTKGAVNNFSFYLGGKLHKKKKSFPCRAENFFTSAAKMLFPMSKTQTRSPSVEFIKWYGVNNGNMSTKPLNYVMRCETTAFMLVINCLMENAHGRKLNAIKLVSRAFSDENSLVAGSFNSTIIPARFDISRIYIGFWTHAREFLNFHALMLNIKSHYKRRLIRNWIKRWLITKQIQFMYPSSNKWKQWSDCHPHRISYLITTTVA